MKSRNLTQQEKDNIIILKKSKGMSSSKLATKFGVSRQTIYNVINSNHTPKQELIDTIKELDEESNKTLLEMIESTAYSNITARALATLDDETLAYEIGKNGIRSIIGIISNSFDKAMAFKRLALDERRLLVQERTLALRERELDMRIENPDAFTTVTIIDDSDKISKWYEENGTDKPYPQN